jgi:hypothetical protein
MQILTQDVQVRTGNHPNIISDRYHVTNLLAVFWLSRKLISVSGTIEEWALKELLLE